MRVRYLAAISPESEVRTRIARRMAVLAGVQPLFERGSLLLFATRPCVPLGPDGVLAGTLFGCGSMSVELGHGGQVSSADDLIEKASGGYVAWFAEEGGGQVKILRAPFGDLPCYWWSSNDLTLVGSDLSMLIAAGMARPTVDPSALARHIAAADLHRPETCLSDVRELQGGDCLTISPGGVDCVPLWSPWRFADPDAAVLHPQLAAQNIRDAVLHAVGCQASRFRSIVLKLSGGLDSSIVAASLAQAKTPFVCLNLATEHPAGDERDYARMVASHLGLPLVERFRRLGDVDLTRSAAARLPRPSAHAFTQASAALVGELARETGADAVFDGGGGDNVFCSLQSARPLADCLLRPAGRQFFWPTARSIASLAEVTLWAVVRRSLAISLRRSPAYRFEFDTRFMAAEAAREACSASPHRWLDCPPGTLPGKAAYVALLAAAQSVVEGADAEDEFPACSPLIAQPVVEACLRVPSWLWFGRGLNRFAARRAFEGDLPRPVIERRSKGAPDCFVAELYEANRGPISELLIGGALDRHGLLDRGSVEAALSDPAPVQGHDFLRLMRLVDVEAWVRAWS